MTKTEGEMEVILGAKRVAGDTDDSHRASSATKNKLISALFYGVSSILVIFTNKAVLTQYNFGYFKFVATVQFVTTSVILLILAVAKKVDIPMISWPIFKEIMPISLMFLGNVLCGLGSTKALNIPMLTALRRGSILMIMLGEWVYLHTKPSNEVVMSVALMVGGALLAAVYDLKFDAFGYMMVFLNNVFTALNGVWMKRASMSGKCSKMGVLFYNSLFSAVIMVLYFSGEHAYYTSQSSVGFTSQMHMPATNLPVSKIVPFAASAESLHKLLHPDSPSQVTSTANAGRVSGSGSGSALADALHTKVANAAAHGQAHHHTHAHSSSTTGAIRQTTTGRGQQQKQKQIRKLQSLRLQHDSEHIARGDAADSDSDEVRHAHGTARIATDNDQDRHNDQDQHEQYLGYWMQNPGGERNKSSPHLRRSSVHRLLLSNGGSLGSASDSGSGSRRAPNHTTTTTAAAASNSGDRAKIQTDKSNVQHGGSGGSSSQNFPPPPPPIASTLTLISQYEGWTNPSFLFMLFVACSMGSILNYSIFLCTTHNSALTTAVGKNGYSLCFFPFTLILFRSYSCMRTYHDAVLLFLLSPICTLYLSVPQRCVISSWDNEERAQHIYRDVHIL